MNFSYQGKEECRLIVSGTDGETQLEAEDGLIVFPPAFWRQLTGHNKGKDVKLTLAILSEGKWKALKPFHFHIAADPIDPYLSYRLVPPGYEGWKKMGIYQRDLQTYEQTPLYENLRMSVFPQAAAKARAAERRRGKRFFFMRRFV